MPSLIEGEGEVGDSCRNIIEMHGRPGRCRNNEDWKIADRRRWPNKLGVSGFASLELAPLFIYWCLDQPGSACNIPTSLQLFKKVSSTEQLNILFYLALRRWCFHQSFISKVVAYQNECVIVVVVGHQATRVSTASLCKLTIILINLCSAGHPLARVGA